MARAVRPRGGGARLRRPERWGRAPALREIGAKSHDVMQPMRYSGGCSQVTGREALAPASSAVRPIAHGRCRWIVARAARLREGVVRLPAGEDEA